MDIGCPFLIELHMPCMNKNKKVQVRDEIQEGISNPYLRNSKKSVRNIFDDIGLVWFSLQAPSQAENAFNLYFMTWVHD